MVLAASLFGDSNFTSAALKESRERLLDFLDELDAAGSDSDRQRRAFQRVVEGFNRQNFESPHAFIETLERDELGGFLNRVADAVGFSYSENDVTAAWRTDW